VLKNLKTLLLDTKWAMYDGFSCFSRKHYNASQIIKLKEVKFGKCFFKLKNKKGKLPTSHCSTTYPCCVPTLGDFAGASRVGLADRKYTIF